MGPGLRRDDERGFDCQTAAPSLRANGSRECAPDDRLREAIHAATKRKNGLLRCARNDVDIAACTISFSRREASEVCIYLSPPKRAWGMPGARCTRSLVCASCSKKHTSKRVHRNCPAFPHAMVLTVSFGLSPVTGLFCHRHQRTNVLSASGWADTTSANLTPASGRQDHTTSPYAAIVSRPHAVDRSQIFRSALQSRCTQTLPRPPHPAPRFVTIMIRPSGGVGWRELVEMICPTG